MEAKFANAAAAYSSVAKSVGTGAAGGTAGAIGSGSAGTASGSFADLVEQSLEAAVKTSENADAMSVQAMAGDANLVDVVTSVSAAEVALETVVSIRDRVIGAYQDIMKMPI